MGFIDFSDYDVEAIDSGGAPAPGKAQFKVVAAEDQGEYYTVECEVIAHDIPKEVGKSSYNTFSKLGKSSKRLLLFAKACGIVTMEELVSANKAAFGIDLELENTVGCTFCGLLVASEYQGKPRCKVEFDFRTTGSPESAKYPQVKVKKDEAEPATEKAGDVPF